jgi:hypothetical protein
MREEEKIVSRTKSVHTSGSTYFWNVISKGKICCGLLVLLAACSRKSHNSWDFFFDFKNLLRWAFADSKIMIENRSGD